MQESECKDVVLVRPAAAAKWEAPRFVAAAGAAASFAWEEFFLGMIRNPHTRSTYLRAVRRFLAWIDSQGMEIKRVTPGAVGRYFDELPASTPSKKVHLAAIRRFMDVLVQRHVIALNPAHSVRTERYSAVEGRTPAITVEQFRQLLASIGSQTLLDLRDRALIGVLIYTTARAGATAKLRTADFREDGGQYVLRFAEKGGKARSIPVRHDLETYIRDYIFAVGLSDAAAESPLFRTATRSGKGLSLVGMNGVDICRMVKRRLRRAGLPTVISPHSFRSCSATDLLLQGVPLEDVQHLLGHADARTTRLYDRRQRQVTRNIVQRISV